MHLRVAEVRFLEGITSFARARAREREISAIMSTKFTRLIYGTERHYHSNFQEPRMDRMLTAFPSLIARKREEDEEWGSDRGGENSIKDLPDAFSAP